MIHAGAVGHHFCVDLEQWVRVLEAQSYAVTWRIHFEAVAVDSKRVEQADGDQVALECRCRVLSSPMNMVLWVLGALTYFLGCMGIGKTLKKKGRCSPDAFLYTAPILRDSKASADPKRICVTSGGPRKSTDNVA